MRILSIRNKVPGNDGISVVPQLFFTRQPWPVRGHPLENVTDHRLDWSCKDPSHCQGRSLLTRHVEDEMARRREYAAIRRLQRLLLKSIGQDESDSMRGRSWQMRANLAELPALIPAFSH